MMTRCFWALMAVAAISGPAAAEEDWRTEASLRLATDYISRGISMSRRQPSASANMEVRRELSSSVVAFGAISLSSVALNDGARIHRSEVTVSTGARNTNDYGVTEVSGSFDIYPISGQAPFRLSNVENMNYAEGRLRHTFSAEDWGSLSLEASYSPSLSNTGARALYAAISVAFPLAASLEASATFGRQFIGDADAAHGYAPLPSYNHWDIGLTWTLGMASFELRYSNTDLRRDGCAALMGPDPGALNSSRACGAALVAALNVTFSN